MRFTAELSAWVPDAVSRQNYYVNSAAPTAMRRRAFLAAVAGTVATGCSETPPANGPAPTDTSTPVPTAEPTPAPSPTATRTAERTDRPTETATEAGPGTETARPGPLDRYIDRARGHLEAAVEAYETQGSGTDPGLLAVTAATKGFSSGAVHARTNDAREWIARAEERDEDRRSDTIADLQTIRVFLDDAANLQTSLVEVFGNVQRAMTSIRRGSYGSARSERRAVARKLDPVADGFAGIGSTTDAAAMDAFDGLTPAQYREKMDQFRAEVDAFETLDTALLTFVRGLESFQRESRLYADDDDAEPDFPRTQFEDVVTPVGELTRPPSLDGTLDELECVSSAFADAAEHMESAVTAREDKDESGAEAAVCDALGALQECEAATGYRAAEPIQSMEPC